MKSWECEAAPPARPDNGGKATPPQALVDLRHLTRSFRFAIAGALHVARTEQNMRVHLLLGGAVMLLGAYLGISAVEWCLVLLCVGAVLAAECFNSSVERLADRISLEEHYLIRMAKDAAAGGVLMASLSAAAVGGVIFLPKLWSKLAGS